MVDRGQWRGKGKIFLPSCLCSTITKLTHLVGTRSWDTYTWTSDIVTPYTSLTWANGFSVSSRHGCWHSRDKTSDFNPFYETWSKAWRWPCPRLFPSTAVTRLKSQRNCHLAELCKPFIHVTIAVRCKTLLPFPYFLMCYHMWFSHCSVSGVSFPFLKEGTEAWRDELAGPRIRIEEVKGFGFESSLLGNLSALWWEMGKAEASPALSMGASVSRSDVF